MAQPIVSAIAAIGKNRELGKDNKLIWKIPDDLKRLKQLTVGHPTIMGRKTFESVLGYLGKPLPESPNIVVTRDPAWTHEGVVVANSVDDAIAKAQEMNAERRPEGRQPRGFWPEGSFRQSLQTASARREIFIIGGTQIFEAALPQTNKLYLTIIDAEDATADAFFPEYEKEFTKKTFEEEREWDAIKYRWIDLERSN